MSHSSISHILTAVRKSNVEEGGEPLSSFAVILLSRQPRRPSGQIAWVRQTVAAIKWLQSNNIGLISSIGMQTWELSAALASMHKLPLRLFLPGVSPADFSAECEAAVSDYDLDPNLVEFIPVHVSSSAGSKKAFMAARDETVVQAADILIPVSLRSGGTMDGILESAGLADKRIVPDFRIEHSERNEPLKTTLEGKDLNPELEQVADKYVIHWTRGANGPWPSEKPIDFYRTILESETWPHTGFDTLVNIMENRLLLASSRHMPSNVETVSLSSLSPTEAIPLMRWRARYGEMSFEPYGIGVQKTYAQTAGILPVSYIEQDADTADSPLWLRQSVGAKTDWRTEQEYRCLGSLNLAQFPVEAMVIFCRTEHEAAILRGRFPYRVVSFLA